MKRQVAQAARQAAVFRTIVLSWLVVLAVVATSLSAGAAPHEPQFDAFGNPLCLSSHPGNEQTGHGALPDCCLVGCCNSVGAAGPSVAGVATLRPKLFGILAPRRSDDAAPSTISLARHPRGPPVLV